MGKKTLVVVIILAIVGVGAYLMVRKAPQSLNNQAPAGTQGKSGNANQSTLKGLLASGKSQKCTYSNKLKSTIINGVIYVANGKMRGDFTSVSDQIKVIGHMIVDGKYSYVWPDMSKQGVKMAIVNQQQQFLNPPGAGENPDINQTSSYVCQGWTEDVAVFTPPSDVSFATIELTPTKSSSNAPSNAGN